MWSTVVRAANDALRGRAGRSHAGRGGYIWSRADEACGALASAHGASCSVAWENVRVRLFPCAVAILIHAIRKGERANSRYNTFVAPNLQENAAVAKPRNLYGKTTPWQAGFDPFRSAAVQSQKISKPAIGCSPQEEADASRMRIAALQVHWPRKR